MNTIQRIQRTRQSGQGMTEYLIIVALIAVAAIGVYSYFGKTVRNQVASVANEVAGDTAAAQTARDAAKTSAATASEKANKDKAMGSYGN